MPESVVRRVPTADRVPTLTEVVELAVRDPGPRAIDTAALVQQVLDAMAPRIDELFEARLRGALAPAVARAVGGLLVDSRHTLAASLRQLVEEAVARALQTPVGGWQSTGPVPGAVPCQPEDGSAR